MGFRLSFVFPFSPHLRKPRTLCFLQQSNPDTNPRGSQVGLFGTCSCSIESTGSVNIGVGHPSSFPWRGWQHPQLILTPGALGTGGFGATAAVSHSWLWLLRMLWLSCPTPGSAGEAKPCPMGWWLCSEGWEGHTHQCSQGVLRCCFVLHRFYC